MPLLPSRPMRAASTLAWIALFLSASVVDATEPTFPRVDPERFGLDMAQGELQEGGGRRVATVDEEGEPAIGLIHVQIGDSYVVKLPNGELVARSPSEATPTDRPFEPMSKDDLAEQLMQGPLSNFSTKQTRRYLYIYNTSENFALATSRILETMFPGVSNYAESHGIETTLPDVPLVVIMFATDEEYQEFDRMPPGIAAYYNILTNRVVMYEQGAYDQARPEIAMRRKFTVIAHEGTHQILHNIGVQERLAVWPMWLTEGMAEYYAPTEPGRRLRWKGAGEVNDMRMFELENYLQLRSNEETDGAMVRDTVLAARLTSTGYASAWSLTHYLARKKRQEFNDYVRDLSTMRPLEGYDQIVEDGIIRENETIFFEHFGEDYAEMENDIVEHLKDLSYTSPFSDLPHCVAMIVMQEGRRTRRDARVFIYPEAAQKWCHDTLDDFTPQQRNNTDVQIRQMNNRREAAQLAAQFRGN